MNAESIYFEIYRHIFAELTQNFNDRCKKDIHCDMIREVKKTFISHFKPLYHSCSAARNALINYFIKYEFVVGKDRLVFTYYYISIYDRNKKICGTVFDMKYFSDINNRPLTGEYLHDIYFHYNAENYKIELSGINNVFLTMQPYYEVKNFVMANKNRIITNIRINDEFIVLFPVYDGNSFYLFKPIRHKESRNSLYYHTIDSIRKYGENQYIDIYVNFMEDFIEKNVFPHIHFWDHDVNNIIKTTIKKLFMRPTSSI